MTDDRIAELLGWPRSRANRDSSLMHRIRIVVAEAQAEQDGHIYRLREQIARDTAQIERMRAALAYADGYIRHHGISRADALRMIDEALGGNDDR